MSVIVSLWQLSGQVNEPVKSQPHIWVLNATMMNLVVLGGIVVSGLGWRLPGGLADTYYQLVSGHMYILPAMTEKIQQPCQKIVWSQESLPFDFSKSLFKSGSIRGSQSYCDFEKTSNMLSASWIATKAIVHTGFVGFISQKKSRKKISHQDLVD